MLTEKKNSTYALAKISFIRDIKENCFVQTGTCECNREERDFEYDGIILCSKRLDCFIGEIVP